MWWRNLPQLRRFARLAIVLGVAGTSAGCWQPLYGTARVPGGEGVQDKFAGIDIPPLKVHKVANGPIGAQGTPDERLAVALRNALQFDLHNGANTTSPLYTLVVTIIGGQYTAVIDPTSGRPTTQIESMFAEYTLVEIATNKIVVKDNAFAHVDYDIPGAQQRFAGQRARRDAEDRAVVVLADTIRNRLASYFVAGT
ncbi:MAG TPA: LPS assembly lipoprotein LptE [Xanthobacteraceae bacterium]|nr:LPS assembly lipoprotein LptE [Xanthobacteraceae bacterium]